MNRITLTISTVLALAFSSPIAAQDFTKGLAALSDGDYATALQEFQPLAEQDVAYAQFILGLMYAMGNGVPQSYAETFKWYQRAAEQGQAQAQFNLGIHYGDGQGVPQDYRKASEWYKLAAKQGFVGAQIMLGVLYQGGNGVLQNDIIAHMWFNIGAANGDENARKWRDNLVSLMTVVGIEKAQAMAKECMESNYKKCEY